MTSEAVVVNYQSWEAGVPLEIKSDVLWTVEVYRLALFACEIGWQDVTKLASDTRTRSLSDQLYRALGSARESRDWYYKAGHLLAEPVATHRIKLLAQIVRLFLVIVPNERAKTLKEETIEYLLTDVPE